MESWVKVKKCTTQFDLVSGSTSTLQFHFICFILTFKCSAFFLFLSLFQFFLRISLTLVGLESLTLSKSEVIYVRLTIDFKSREKNTKKCYKMHNWIAFWFPRISCLFSCHILCVQLPFSKLKLTCVKLYSME